MSLVHVFFGPFHVTESSGDIFQPIQYIYFRMLTSLSYLIPTSVSCHVKPSISDSLTVQHYVFHASRKHLRIELTTIVVRQYNMLSDIPNDLLYLNFLCSV